MDGGLLLTQEKYAIDLLLLRRADMQNCKTADTPLSSAEKLCAHGGTPLGPKDAKIYTEPYLEGYNI